MSNRPSNVTNLHAIAFLYLSMAKDDGQITESEAQLLIERLYKYNPENIEFNNQVIVETQNWLYSFTEINDLGIVVKELIDGLSTLSADMKSTILNDLEEIAQEDGFIHSNERELYNYLLEAFS
jgi:uncharacterized tellurite resistance protein B-like protein